MQWNIPDSLGGVHAATIAIAVAEAGRRPAQFEGTVSATTEAVRQWVRHPEVDTSTVSRSRSHEF